MKGVQTMQNNTFIPWDWNIAKKDMWLMPCEESYYYAAKWKGEGCRSVLDLGCGLGRHAILFAKSGFKVTAADISNEALDYLRKWQKDEGVDIRCRQADMSLLPFADDAFDCVFAMHSAGHCDTAGMEQTVAEIARVLKPEGSVFLTLCSKERESFNSGEMTVVDENTRLKNEGPEKNVPHFFADLDDIERLFSQFELIKVRHVDDCWSGGMRRDAKHYFIEAKIHKEPAKLDFSDIIGKSVSGVIDRPMGTAHPRCPDMIYPVNYGYVEGVFAGDGAEQDIYLLGADKPQDRFSGKVIAVYHRLNDCEDKWIVSADGRDHSDSEILSAIEFQEKFFDGVLYRK